MTHKLNGMDWTAITLLVIGGINWGLIGFFGFDLVAAIFGEFTGLTRVIYALVGLSALYMIATGSKIGQLSKEDSQYHNMTSGSRAM